MACFGVLGVLVRRNTRPSAMGRIGRIMRNGGKASFPVYIGNNQDNWQLSDYGSQTDLIFRTIKLMFISCVFPMSLGPNADRVLMPVEGKLVDLNRI